MPTAAELAQRQLDAYNAHDLEAFAACYHPDVEVRRLPGGEITMAGRDALRKSYGDLFAKIPGRRADLLGRIECGNFCVDHESVTDGPGTPVKYAVAIYEEADGLLRRVWFPPVAAGGNP